ncbi:MAG: hypothetical protein SFX72_01575 [Isosphaeraceae bacterium]|nr:hypothetical protein [Isosphaeraceae bacterium]
MHSDQPEPTSHEASAGSPVDLGHQPLVDVPVSRSWRAGTGAMAVIVALVSGTVAWGIGEATYDLFQPSKEAASQPYAFKQLNAEKNRADGINGSIAFGALGGLLGLGLGCVGAWAAQAPRRIPAAAVLGLVLGTVAGAAPCPFLIPLYHQHYDPEVPDLKLPLVIHAGIWCSLGAAAGLAFGFGYSDKRKLAAIFLGGFLGAFAATVLFDVLGAILFPFSEADVPISPSLPARILARLIVAVGVALGVVVAARRN